jgi:hypothetical protein
VDGGQRFGITVFGKTEVVSGQSRNLKPSEKIDMATREAVAQKVEPKAQAEPRFIWQEVDDQLNILETGILAVEVLEADYFTDSTHGPVVCSLQGGLNQLKALLTEIQENPDVVNSQQVPGIHPERSEDDRRTDS